MRKGRRREVSLTGLEVVVKQRQSTAWRVVRVATATGLALLLLLLVFEFGRRSSSPDAFVLQEELETVRAKFARALVQRDEADSKQSVAQSTLSIEQSVAAGLGSHLKELEDENARLKADLAFYEQLLPADAGAALSVRSAEAHQETAKGLNELRFRVLIGQGSKATKLFRGTLQIVATVMDDGKELKLEMPQNRAAPAPEYTLSFRLFQRVQGALTLPPGATVRSVQVRVHDESAAVVMEQSIPTGH
jgi:hypothetical protein